MDYSIIFFFLQKVKRKFFILLVTPEKNELENEEYVETESEIEERLEDFDKKTIRVKPLGGPLLAQKYVALVHYFEITW